MKEEKLFLIQKQVVAYVEDIKPKLRSVEILNKIHVILGLSLGILIMIYIFLTYLIRVTLKENNVEAYSYFDLLSFLNHKRLKIIMHKDIFAKQLYYTTKIILILIASDIFFMVVMAIISG